MTYEEALQIALEELDEKIEYLSDTFQGHSARIESYIYDLSMARKALMQASGEKREWVGLTDHEILCLWGLESEPQLWGNMVYVRGFGREIEAKLKEKNT